MRVGNYRGQPENITAYQICYLSAHSGKQQQVVHTARHLAAEAFDYHARSVDEILRLGAEKSARTNYLLKFDKVGIRHSRSVRIMLEKRHGNDIHPFVGALCRQPPEHKQPPRIALVVQRTLGCGKVFFKRRDYRRRTRPLGAFCFFHGIISVWLGGFDGKNSEIKVADFEET